jgi:hypothetical protein
VLCGVSRPGMRSKEARCAQDLDLTLTTLPTQESAPEALSASQAEGRDDPRTTVLKIPSEYSQLNQNSGLKAIVMYIACGAIVTFALLVAKLLIEKLPFAMQAEYETRAYLLRLLPEFRETGADAIVLDISHLIGGTRDAQTLRRVATPRDSLLALLERLVELSPAAIGIDIDFSGDGHGWLDPKDPIFFERCLELNRRIPIRLGVSRSIPSPDGRWLVSPKYSPLAAAIYVTNSDSGDMPISVGVKDSSLRLPTLGASLAAAAKAGGWDPLALTSQDRSTKSWMFEEVVERRVALAPYSLLLHSQEAPVNFSVVRQLAREYIPKVQPEDLIRYAPRITGRVVVLGDVENPQDVYPVPGDRVNRSGVFLHAAQSHTFTSEPVYVFSHTFRIVLDVAIPFAIMVCVLLVRWLMQNTTAQQLRRAEFVVLYLAASGVVLAAFVMADRWRVFWLDFLLVLVFVLIHRPVEHRLLKRLTKDGGSVHG